MISFTQQPVSERCHRSQYRRFHAFARPRGALVIIALFGLRIALPPAAVGAEDPGVRPAHLALSSGFHQSEDPRANAAVGDVFAAALEADGPLLGSLAAIPVVDDSGGQPAPDLLEAFFGAEGRHPGIVSTEVARFGDGAPAARRIVVSFSHKSSSGVGFELQLSRDLRHWDPAHVVVTETDAGDFIEVSATVEESLLDMLPGDPLPPLFFRLRLHP